VVAALDPGAAKIIGPGLPHGERIAVELSRSSRVAQTTSTGQVSFLPTRRRREQRRDAMPGRVASAGARGAATPAAPSPMTDAEDDVADVDAVEREPLVHPV
jgi:hypothetical protein